MADVTKKHFCPKKFKGVRAVKEWWGTSGRKEQRVYRQDELEDGSKPADDYIIPATIYGSGFWWCGPAIALFSVFGTGNDFLC